jgi:hypothetical protein
MCDNGWFESSHRFDLSQMSFVVDFDKAYTRISKYYLKYDAATSSRTIYKHLPFSVLTAVEFPPR